MKSWKNTASDRFDTKMTLIGLIVTGIILIVASIIVFTNSFQLKKPVIFNRFINDLPICYDKERKIFRDGLIEIDTVKQQVNAGFKLTDSIVSINGYCRVEEGSVSIGQQTLKIEGGSNDNWGESIVSNKSINSKEAIPYTISVLLPIVNKDLHSFVKANLSLHVVYPFESSKGFINIGHTFKRQFLLYIITLNEMKLKVMLNNYQSNWKTLTICSFLFAIGFLLIFLSIRGLKRL